MRPHFGANVGKGMENMLCCSETEEPKPEVARSLHFWFERGKGG
jgi:hypothetical protein